MIIALLLLLAATAQPAFAYIDPNASGLLFQILTPLLAMLAVVWVGFRRTLQAWYRAVAAFLGIGKAGDEPLDK